MWKIEDFWKVFNFIKTNDPSDLSDVTQAVVKSEEANSIKLFENTLDQLSFNTIEYNRLRDFLIKWYSASKSLTAIQKNISDLYGMPDEHLDEAFRSKGLNFSTQLSTYGTQINYNKVNFYYDLVNFYKHKGSPRTLLNTLTYFGFPNIEILEYFTHVRRSTQKVEFHSISSDHTGKWYSTKTDILPYNEVTKWDPHYMTSEKSIVFGQNNNQLHLPTKSPYFSLRHFINLNDYIKLMSFISRKIQDQYKEWHLALLTRKTNEKTSSNIFTLPREVYINSCTMEASVLELYLVCIHTYYRHYGTELEIKHPTDSVWDTTSQLGDHGRDYLCYDGTDASYMNIINDFETYIEKGHQKYVSCVDVPIEIECYEETGLTRDELKENQEYFYDNFTRLADGNFLKNEKIAGIILKAINPELFQRVNDLYDIKPDTIILGNLLEDLMKWVSSYASIALPHLNFVLFGTSEFKRLMNPLIDFFKPYHARLLGYDLAFIHDDRNSESVIVEDNVINSIEEVIHDWDTCNSKPCCNDTCSEATPDSFYSRDTYDCGSFYDIGGACDGRDNSFVTEIEDHIIEPLNCLTGFTVIADYENPAHPDYQKDAYVETSYTGGIIDINTDIDNQPLYYEAQSGNMMDFDCDGCFDGQYGSDVCMIQVIDSVPSPWLDITANMSISSRGTWDGTQFNSESAAAGKLIFLNTSTPVAGTVTKLRATFVSFVADVSWSWPDSSMVFDGIAPYPSNTFEWTTNWNKLGMRFSVPNTGSDYSIVKIEAFIT